MTCRTLADVLAGCYFWSMAFTVTRKPYACKGTWHPNYGLYHRCGVRN